MSERIQVCGTPERANQSICRFDGTTWDGTRWRGEPQPVDVPYYLGGVPAQYHDAIDWAWAQWAKVCAIAPRRAESLSDRGPKGLIVVYERGPIDGGGSTLAWAELPCGGDRSYRSKMDQSERWIFDPEASPAGGIHLGGVMCHENGHLLGLPHDPTPARSLLDPTYGPDVITPQAWDIAQAQLRYGKPIAATPPSPDPTPPPTPPPADRIVVEVGGDRYAIPAEKLS